MGLDIVVRKTHIPTFRKIQILQNFRNFQNFSNIFFKDYEVSKALSFGIHFMQFFQEGAST